MKKLLMLLVFSASMFASAQTLTLVELTSSNGRGTFGPHAIHAIQGTDITPFQYEGYTTSVTSYTISGDTFTAPDDIYRLVGSFGHSARDFIYTIGPGGRFFNATAQLELEGVNPAAYYVDNIRASFIASPDWGILEGYPSHDERLACGYRFLSVQSGSRGFVLTRHTFDGNTPTLMYANEAPSLDYSGAHFRTADDVISAVNDFLAVATSCQPVDPCDLSVRSSVLDKYPALNEGRAFGSYVAGTTDWNPQGTENTVWTYSIPREEQASGRGGFYYQISEIDSENVFRLYRGHENVGIAGDSGSLGSYEEFECLEDLIAVL